jgi:hypothetical protein
MSFNCRGLAGPIKKSSFIRVVTLEHPDVILLQETLGLGVVVKERLESWLPGWTFETLDVRGHFGGLVVGWKGKLYETTQFLGVGLNSLEWNCCLWSLELISQ